MTEFRIEYTIQRRDEDDKDFVDIGFGSSGGWSTINAASHAIESDIQNRSWEIEPHMPDPEDAELVHGSGEPVASGPACDCSCHTMPGVMHVAACCSTGLTDHNEQEQR